MSLPTRAAVEDVDAICGYFAKKPKGASIGEAKAALGSARLDSRKVYALKFWGLIEDTEQGLKVTELGRAFARDKANQPNILADIVRRVDPYRAIIERAVHRKEKSLSSVDVSAHWNDHFRAEISDNDEILNEQAVCFFQLAGGAKLGTLIVGRKGSPTRFDFDEDAISTFLEGEPYQAQAGAVVTDEAVDQESLAEIFPHVVKPVGGRTGQGIFIAHGKNKGPLEQLQKILDQFKIPYKVAVDEPNLGRPIGTKIREIMEACNCAILIFTADEEFKDKDGNAVWRPSENVVYELGAAGYLYDKQIVIMKEESVRFPSNFSDLGYIPFTKDQLDSKTLDILKELIGFGIVKVST